MQTLERSYLLRVNGVVVERPQHMLMRVSVGIHKEVRARGMGSQKAQASVHARQALLAKPKQQRNSMGAQSALTQA